MITGKYKLLIMILKRVKLLITGVEIEGDIRYN